jgi:hypothetical protein
MISKRLMVPTVYGPGEVYFGQGAVMVLKSIEAREFLVLVTQPVKSSEHYGKVGKYLEGKVFHEEVVEEPRAVLPGKILYADWFKGFGNIVIIDHGDHTFTVSGYCSELLKKPGESVSEGETIALVGSAGSLKGPCLYFEIRHHGKPQDPMNWLSHLDRVVSLPEENRKGK